MDAHLSKPDFSYLKPPPEVVKLIQHDGQSITSKEVRLRSMSGRSSTTQSSMSTRRQKSKSLKMLSKLIRSICRKSCCFSKHKLFFSWSVEKTLKYVYSGNFLVDKSIESIRQHLAWLANPDFQELTPEAEDYLKRGVVYNLGRDRQLRPVVYIQIHKVSTKPKDIKVLLCAVCNLLNYVKESMFVPYFVENWIIVLDVNHMSVFSLPYKLIGEIINMCAKNYTSTVEIMYILNPSYILQLGWDLIKKMIHPETAAKINFLRTNDFFRLQERIASDQLEVKYGGSFPNQTVYWPIINTLNHPDIQRQQSQRNQLPNELMEESLYHTLNDDSQDFYNRDFEKVENMNFKSYPSSTQDLPEQASRSCSCSCSLM